MVAILCVVVVLVVVVGILWKGRSVVVVVVVSSFLDIKYDYDLRVDLDLGPLNKGQPINCTNFTYGSLISMLFTQCLLIIITIKTKQRIVSNKI